MTVLSLASILAESARRTPDAPAVVERTGDRRASSRTPTCGAHARQLRRRPAAQGSAPATGWRCWPRTSPTSSAPTTASSRPGGMVVPVPTLLNADEAAYIVRHSGARAVLYDASFADVGTARPPRRVGVPAWDIAALGADGARAGAHARRPRGRGHRR